MTVIVNLMTIFKVTEMNMFPLRFINYSFFICKFAETFPAHHIYKFILWHH